MAAYAETLLPGEPAFQPGEVAVRKINHGTAVGAYQVVVVPGGTAHQVAPAAAAGVRLADKTESGQRLQRAVDGHQPDAGVLPPYPTVDFRRGEVLAAPGDGPHDGTPLRGNLIAALPQRALNLPDVVQHPVCQMKMIIV